jgi:hypothetical protein|tara:strand:+ start:31 stop:354 length:324 start_codon:yes stop_codon:yes gene_type:complete
MLKEFVSLVDSKDEIVDVASLFSKAELQKWEKWIEIFESIRIDNVAIGLKQVSKTYKLNKTEEVTVLAYVKFLELMIHNVGRMEEEMKGNEFAKKTVSPKVNEVMYG